MQDLMHTLSCCKINTLRSPVPLFPASPEHLTPFKHQWPLMYSCQH